MADPDVTTRQITVMLSARCTSDIDVVRATEVLARAAASLGLEGMHPMLTIDHDDEDDT